MPVRTVPGTDTQYHLINFDENGVERAEADGSMLSAAVRARIADPSEGITDVFFSSHGWKGDIPAAIQQYDKWVGAMVTSTDRTAVQAKRPDFKSIVVGVHWPSLPFGDETLEAAAVLGVDDGTSIEAEIDSYAASISTTRLAREAIRIILTDAHQDSGESEELPDHVRNAYEMLAREAQMPGGSDNPGGAPGDEQGEWNADDIYRQERAVAIEEAGDGDAGGGVPGLLGDGFIRRFLKKAKVGVLQQMSFWKMKDRARQIGEGGVHNLLVQLQKAAPVTTRFHLMGHSFGCIVMSATVAGTPGGEPLVRPVDSLFLVQGALSLWSYSPNLPIAPGKAGYFHRIVTQELVRGPIVTTQSHLDTAVKTLYPAAVVVKSQFLLGEEYPKYGGVGMFGLQGLGAVGTNISMEPVTHDYGFQSKRVYNLESSHVIKKNEGLGSGAHSDIAHPEVAHAMWQAVLSVTV